MQSRENSTEIELGIKFNSENELIDYVKTKIGDDIQYSFRGYENFFKAALSYFLARYDEYCFPATATNILLKIIEKQKGFKIRFNKQEFVRFVGDFYKSQLFVFENEAQIDSKLKRLAKIVNEGKVKGSIYPWIMIYSMAVFYLRQQKDRIEGMILPSDISVEMKEWIHKKLRTAGFPTIIQFDSIRLYLDRFIASGGFKVKKGGYRPVPRVQKKTSQRRPEQPLNTREIADHVANIAREKGLTFGYRVKPRIR